MLDGPIITSSRLRKRLIEEGIKEDKCEMCGLGNIWNYKRLSMQLDHKNGNRRDCRLDNLRVICPNCHTQTETHSKIKGGVCFNYIKQNIKCIGCGSILGRKTKTGLCLKCCVKAKNLKSKQYSCVHCSTKLKRATKSGLCFGCIKILIMPKRRKVKNRPDKEELLGLIERIGYCATARKFGVTDNCIRKWLRTN